MLEAAEVLAKEFHWSKLIDKNEKRRIPNTNDNINIWKEETQHGFYSK